MDLLFHPKAQDRVNASRATSSLIIHGHPGVGKTTLARHLARLALCLEPAPSAGACDACRLLAAGNHPDLIVLAPMDKASVTIEQVRGLSQNLSLKPYYPDGYRTVIIDEAQTLTTEAQNALLKLIEEPPPRTRFILVTHALESLLPTIRSRCQTLYLPLVPEAILAQWLTDTRHLPSHQASSLAEAAAGAPGVALQLLADPDMLAAQHQLHQEAQGLATTSVFNRLVLAKTLIDRHADLVQFSRYLHAHALGDLEEAADAPTTARRLQAITTLRARLKANVAPRVAIECLMVEYPS